MKHPKLFWIALLLLGLGALVAQDTFGPIGGGTGGNATNAQPPSAVLTNLANNPHTDYTNQNLLAWTNSGGIVKLIGSPTKVTNQTALDVAGYSTFYGSALLPSATTFDIRTNSFIDNADDLNAFYGFMPGSAGYAFAGYLAHSWVFGSNSSPWMVLRRKDLTNSIAVVSPLTNAGPTIGIPPATDAQAGYLTAADHVAYGGRVTTVNTNGVALAAPPLGASFINFISSPFVSFLATNGAGQYDVQPNFSARTGTLEVSNVNVSGTLNVTNGVNSYSTLGTGTNGAITLYESNGTHGFTLMAPNIIQTNNTLLGLSNATSGVLVAGGVGTGTNQVYAVGNAAGMLTNNGTGTFGWMAIPASGTATNALIQTNGVNVGSAGTVNFVAGNNTTVTGLLAGAVATVGVSSTASGGGGAPYITTLRQQNTLFDDLAQYDGHSAVPSGQFGLIWEANGTWFTEPGDTNAPGIVRGTSGGTVGNYAALYNVRTGGSGPYALFGGSWTNEWRFQISGTNNTTDNTLYVWGFGDQTTAEPQNGIYCRYDSNSAFFVFIAAANGNRTTNITVTIPAPATWYRFRTESVIDATGTNVNCYLNETNTFNFTTAHNVPGANRTTGIQNLCKKITGTLTSTNKIDYIYLSYKLNVSR